MVLTKSAGGAAAGGGVSVAGGAGGAAAGGGVSVAGGAVAGGAVAGGVSVAGGAVAGGVSVAGGGACVSPPPALSSAPLAVGANIPRIRITVTKIGKIIIAIGLCTMSCKNDYNLIKLVPRE
jgi:hypothetical protein